MTASLIDGGPFVLLASYPKSGNTWVRALLSAYLSEDKVDLAALIGLPILCGRYDFDDLTGLASADLSLDEIDLARPSFHRALGELYRAPWFVKVHDAWYRNSAGVPVFGPESCRGAVCIVRHPGAVLWSFAQFSAKPLEHVVQIMAEPDRLHDWWADAIDTRLPQRLLSWSGHVASWLDQSELPVLLLRYEDLIENPSMAMAAILSFAGLPVDPSRLVQAAAAASFDRLRELEQVDGFRERPATAARFFRSGRADAWREHVPAALQDRIAQDHGAMMQRLEYAA